MMTIAQRVVVFQCAAKAAKTDTLRKMYNETAAVLEAQSAAYNDLYAAADCAIQEGDSHADDRGQEKAHARKERCGITAHPTINLKNKDE